METDSEISGLGPKLSVSSEMDIDNDLAAFRRSVSLDNCLPEQPCAISWGRSDFGNLLSRRFEDFNDGVVEFEIVGRTITSISSSTYHTAAVTSTGELFVCGQNDVGQVSEDKSVSEICRPTLLEALSTQRAVSVACGSAHTAVVTASGCAMTFGGNECGQLGHSGQKIDFVGPRVVTFSYMSRSSPIIVTKAACGHTFSLFLTTTGEVFGCGAVEYLGLRLATSTSHSNSDSAATSTYTSSTNLHSAVKVDSLVGVYVKDIVAGASHVLAQSNQHDVYVWGRHSHGELGLPQLEPAAQHVQVPQKLPLPMLDATGGEVVVGMAAGSMHSLLWTSTGRLLGSGDNKYGQVGLFLPRVMTMEHIPIDTGYVVMAACGAFHSLVLVRALAVGAVRSTSVLSLQRALSSGIVRVPSVAAALPSTSSQPALSGSSQPIHTTRVMGFGWNSFQQVTARHSQSTITMCRGPVEVPITHTAAGAPRDILYIAAGGDCSFAIADSGTAAPSSTVPTASASNRLRKQFSSVASKAVVPVTVAQFSALLQTALSSFGDDTAASAAARPLSSEVALDIQAHVSEVFASPSLLAASFMSSSTPTVPALNLDVEGLESIYESILRLASCREGVGEDAEEWTQTLPSRLMHSLEVCLGELERLLLVPASAEDRSPGDSMELRALRVLLVLWQSPLSASNEAASLRSRLVRLLTLPRVFTLLVDTLVSSLPAAGVALDALYPMPLFASRLVRPLLEHWNSLCKQHVQQLQHFMPSRRGLTPGATPWRELQQTGTLLQLLHELAVRRTKEEALADQLTSLADMAQSLSSQLCAVTQSFHSEAAEKVLSDAVLVTDFLQWREFQRQLRQTRAGAATSTNSRWTELQRVLTALSGSGSSTAPHTSFFFLSRFAVWAYSPQVKRRVFLAEASLAQQAAQQRAFLNLFTAASNMLAVQPFLVLEVQRGDQLVQQTMQQISAALRVSPGAEGGVCAELQKPLKVVFSGEEGVDAGGVQREFFQLLVQQLLAPGFGLFEPAPTGRAQYFCRGNSAWTADEYALVGTVLALAVHNDVLLDLPLPPVFYRLLLWLAGREQAAQSRSQSQTQNQTAAEAAEDELALLCPEQAEALLTLRDLADLDPDLAQGLQALLRFEPAESVEHVFCRSFAVEFHTQFGEQLVLDLLPMDGADTPVTHLNRADFVRRYVYTALFGSVRDAYAQLYRGFARVLSPETLLTLRFSAEEVRLLVQGSELLDFRALEAATEYIGDSEWRAEHPLLRGFWEVLHGWDLQQKQRFLRFVSGSAQAPIGGLQQLALKIQRAGPDSEALPTAHTCFVTLLLPEYASVHKLRDRLERAIVECEGFGLK